MDVAVGPDAAWVTNGSAGTLSRLDPVSGKLLGRIRVGRYPTAVAIGLKAVWVVDSGQGAVVRVARENLVVGEPIKVGRDPAGRGYAWVVNRGDGTVSRFSLAGGAVVGKPSRVGGAPTATAVGRGGVLVLDAEGGRLVRLDPRTGAVGRVVELGGAPGSIAIADGSAWITDAANATITRIGA